METITTQKIEGDAIEPPKRPRGRPKKPPQPPKEKQPRRKSEKPTKYNGREKEYFQDYYKLRCKPCGCEHCGLTFTMERSLTRHLARNKNCRLKRLEEQVKTLMEKEGTNQPTEL